MELQRVIQYSDLYPEDAGNLPDAKPLIKGLTREDLCTITANMVQRISGKPFWNENLNPEKGEYDFVSFFFSPQSRDFSQQLVERYDAAKKRLPNDYTRDYIATSKVAIMNFQRLFFSVEPDIWQDNTTQIEENFSKALLLVNEKVYEVDYEGDEYESEAADLQLARLYLAYNYANEDVEASDYHDLFRRQLTKSVTLFSFLFRSKDKRIKILRERFLSHFHLGSWVEYLIPHIMSIHFLKESSGLLILKGGGKYAKKARRVLEKSCIGKDIIIFEKDNPDFVAFRSYPFIRIRKHQYAITNPAFVVEHMFNSIYFELKRYRKDAGFKSDDEFRQFYTTEYSQKYMFEGFVNLCMPANAVVAISGSQCDNHLKEAKKQRINTNGVIPPDFYIRAPEGCIVFEYKDALTNAKVKESRDAETLFADIKEKFFVNDRGRHKGITQLLDSAAHIQNESFFFDRPPRDSMIYLVLVVDNPVYTMRGMHTILESMMREECDRRGMQTERIKPIILMDVASLKLYADFLKVHGIINAFEDYYRYTDPNGVVAGNDPFEPLISFTDFLKDNKVRNMGRVFERLLHEAKPILDKYK